MPSSPEPLAETARGHDRIHPYAPGAAEDIVGHVVETYARLDVLVNNAAIVRSASLADSAPELITAQLDTDLVAPVLLARAALGALEASGGVIVNVSTAVGQRGWPGNSVYAATKAVLETLTRGWAVELAPRGVRVVAVAPGAIETPIADHSGLSPERRAEVRAWQLAHTPLGRIGGPEEVAWAISRLASPGASFITGAVLPVDGGAVVG
ncbi:SDR family NAD(P)-dependent oxidoreductase [Streptomyces sp. NPDC021212]|uniref:SDR family NAD(P)-dependent oxidoreductase n=1 Tax=Streptomyces sp. NPDC021212 TaxID=3365118 RepID=UPI0037B53938